MGEDERVYGYDGERDEIERQQRQIFAHYHLKSRDRQGIEELICFLPALLGDDPHGEHGDYHDEYQAAEAEDIFKVAHRRPDVISHGADADEHQQESAEHIGRQRVEIVPEFVFENCDHFFASPLSAPPSVSSMKISSRSAFLSAISTRALSRRAKAKKIERESP